MNNIETFTDNLEAAIINPLITLLFAAALVAFLWGVVEFIANADNPAAREKGSKHMFWSIIGMVIMAGVFGVIQLLKNTFGI